MIRITKRSVFTGKLNSMILPVTLEEIRAWQNGVLIQVAMPQLDADQAEFLKTGATPQEWNAFIPDI